MWTVKPMPPCFSWPLSNQFHPIIIPIMFFSSALLKWRHLSLIFWTSFEIPYLCDLPTLFALVIYFYVTNDFLTFWTTRQSCGFSSWFCGWEIWKGLLGRLFSGSMWSQLGQLRLQGTHSRWWLLNAHVWYTSDALVQRSILSLSFALSSSLYMASQYANIRGLHWLGPLKARWSQDSHTFYLVDWLSSERKKKLHKNLKALLRTGTSFPSNSTRENNHPCSSSEDISPTSRWSNCKVTLQKSVEWEISWLPRYNANPYYLAVCLVGIRYIDPWFYVYLFFNF